MKNNWNGLVKILQIWITNAQGEILWQDENLYNMFHLSGEEFLLKAAFVGGVTNTIIPSNYYLGLDNRTTIDADDTMETITDVGEEPTSNGYSRVAVSSSGVFTVSLSGSHYRANSPIISFSATGGSYGPVKNLFLTTKNDNTGVLIASVALTQTITPTAGDTINMRLGLSLKDCP